MTDNAHAGAGHTRRELIGRSFAVGLGIGAAGLLGQIPARAGSLDYTDPATFDAFQRTFEGRPDRVGQSTDLNECVGALAWGQSYIQVGMLRMFEAFGDRRYLDDLAGHIDDVLATRDSVRGVSDHRGLSLPAWRSAYPYTMGGADLVDDTGRRILQVRSVRTPIERLVTLKPFVVEPLIEVTVSAGSAPDRFTLAVRHTDVDVTDVFENVSMHRESPDYVVSRMHARWPTQNSVTVKDLREDATAAGMPALGAVPMHSLPAVFGVHTGQIVHPMAWFARLVLTSPALRRDRILRAKAEAFADAAIKAVAVHDDEWRENHDGDGWYDFRRGEPSGFDGAEQPANQFLALGRAQLQLAAISGGATYKDRAAKMASTLRRQLAADDDDAYVWHYWPTWGRVYNGWDVADDVSEFRLSYCCAQQVEDISHAHLDVDFAVQALRDRVAFQGRDMARLARTFTRNLATVDDKGEPTVWYNVDGSFRKGVESDELVAAGWMPIAAWDAEVFQHCNRMYVTDGLTPDHPSLSGYMLMGVANLAWFAAGRR